MLKLEGCLGRADFHGEEAVAGAGVSLSGLIREAAALNLGGIECLVGIPATIGGAVAMNAGTPDGFIGDFVSAVYFLHPDGTMGEFKPGAGSFSYRMFSAPARRRDHRGAARSAPAARRRDREGDQAAAQAEEDEPAARRWPPRAACGRTRPARRRAASSRRWGSKGKRHNGAEISAKHANFIVNRGGATAADIKALMDMTSERVQSQFGIALETEIKTLGEI